MERHPALMARSAEELIATFGKPFADEQFTTDEEQGVYRGGVASQLPAASKGNSHAKVREMIWQRAGCNFIIRLTHSEGFWRAFDAFEAPANADF